MSSQPLSESVYDFAISESEKGENDLSHEIRFRKKYGQEAVFHHLLTTIRSLVLLCWWGCQNVCLIYLRYIVNVGAFSPSHLAFQGVYPGNPKHLDNSLEMK